MENIFNAAGCLCLILFISVTSYAKGWRGIIPFHSTRADVERLLGSPPPPPVDGRIFYTPDKGSSIYSLDEGDILIVYANDKVPAAVPCLGKIPIDTVLLIEVTTKKEMRLSDLPVNQSRLAKFDPSNPPGMGYEGYLDDEEGIVIRVFAGRVEQVSYIAASRDRPLCPGYYEDPRSFVGLLICGLPAPQPPCPTITVRAPADMAEVGATITFSVTVSGGDSDATPIFKWAVPAGRITSGQGTTTIRVDTAGAEEKSIKATVEVRGYNRYCVTEASGETQLKRVGNEKQFSAGGPRKP